jgi:ABC-2 type transport system ATP-binding protein
MRYGDVEALRGIDLDVKRGEIFAFLGPNGAGKTTAVEILEGYRQRDSGVVEVLGVDPERGDPGWRGRVGVVLQDSVPEPELSAVETLEMYAGFYDAALPVDDVLALVGLGEQATIRNDRLSGGQRRRLDFALALIGDPEVIFLDEPTTGFDPAARRAAWNTIAGLRNLGKTIFLTTHYLEEAEALADRIAVIVGGRIVAEGTPTALAGRDRAPTEIGVDLVSGTTLPAPPTDLAERLDVRDGHVQLRSLSPVRDLHRLCTWLIDNDLEAVTIDVHQPTLEETYLRLTEESDQ